MWNKYRCPSIVLSMNGKGSDHEKRAEHRMDHSWHYSPGYFCLGQRTWQENRQNVHRHQVPGGEGLSSL
jgi:hypothetical protein